MSKKEGEREREWEWVSDQKKTRRKASETVGQQYLSKHMEDVQTVFLLWDHRQILHDCTHFTFWNKNFLSNLSKYFSGWLACSTSTGTALLNVRSCDAAAGLCLLNHFSGDCRGLKFLVHIQRFPSAQRIWYNALGDRSSQLGSRGSLCMVARDGSSMWSHGDSCLRRMDWNSNGQGVMDWNRALAWAHQGWKHNLGLVIAAGSTLKGIKTKQSQKAWSKSQPVKWKIPKIKKNQFFSPLDHFHHMPICTHCKSLDCREVLWYCSCCHWFID